MELSIPLKNVFNVNHQAMKKIKKDNLNVLFVLNKVSIFIMNTKLILSFKRIKRN